MYPPPRNGKVEISGQCDILVLADVPPPRIGKVEASSSDFRCNVHPPPPRNGKVEISGQCDILVLVDVPPPPTRMEKLKSQVNATFWFWLMYPPPPTNQKLTKRECYRTKSFQERSSSTFYNLPPPPFPVPLSDSMPEQETGEFQFQMDMDIWTLTPSATPHQPKKKNELFVFFDYIQLLMIGWAG